MAVSKEVIVSSNEMLDPCGIDEETCLCTIPKYVVLGMVHHDAFTGKRVPSPFNFRRNNVEYQALCQDGRQVPAKAFQPQFDHHNLVREFYNM